MHKTLIIELFHLHMYSCTLPYSQYFFGYKTEFFFSQNNAKNLDPSYKMDLDLLMPKI